MIIKGNNIQLVCILCFLLSGCLVFSDSGSGINSIEDECHNPQYFYDGHIVAGLGSSYAGSIGFRAVSILIPNKIDNKLFVYAKLVSAKKPRLDVPLVKGEYDNSYVDFSNQIKSGIDYYTSIFFAEIGRLQGEFCVIAVYEEEHNAKNRHIEALLLDKKISGVFVVDHDFTLEK